MAFDFATGQNIPDQPATPASPKPTTTPKASGAFDFASGTYSGGAPTPSFQTPQTEPKESFGHHLLDVGRNFVKNTWDVYKTTPHKIVEDIEAGARDIEEGNVLKGIAKSGFRTAADAANAIFAPLSAAIGSVLEEAGGQKLTDSAGQIIADRSGISDLPAFQKFAMEHPNAGEDFNRLLTLVMSKGEKGRIDPKAALNEFHATAKKIVSQAEKPPTTITPKSATPGEQRVNISTPKSRFAEYNKKQGYEPYIPEDQLPVIDYGKTPKAPKSDLPTIQVGEKGRTGKLVDKDYRYEPLPEQSVRMAKEKVINPENFRSPEQMMVQKIASQFKRAEAPTERITVSERPRRSQPTTEIPEDGKVTKAAADISDELVTKGFEKIPESELSKFDPITKKTQIENVTNLMRSNLEDSIAMAKGEKPVLGDVHPQVLFESVKQHAMKQKDYQLLLDLAKSPLGTHLSEAGQTLSAKAFSMIENDPVKAIRDIQKAREAKVSRTTKGKTVEQAKTEIVKKLKADKPIKKPSKQNLSDFIESIKCS